MSAPRDDLPIAWDTTSEPSAFDPANWFDYCEMVTGRKRPELPPLAVQTVIRSHLDLASEWFGVESDDFTLADHPFLRFAYRGHDVALAYSPKGSYAAGGLDELIALGARSIIVLGGAATLVHNIEVDDLVIPTMALRDEGVSFHYQPPSRYNRPSERLVRSLTNVAEQANVRFHTGPVWTTTAHFRQSLPRLRAFRAEGCVAVNNEASPAFAVAWLRGVDVGFLLSIGDTLADDRFRVPAGHPKLYGPEDARKQLEIALDALVLDTDDASC